MKTPTKYLLRNFPGATQVKDARYFAWQKLQANRKRLGKPVQTWQEHKALKNK